MKRLFVALLCVLSLGHAQMNHGGVDMDMLMTGDLNELDGEAFEIAFMSGMIVHHEGAVEMAQWILERTELPGVSASAKQIIAAQEPEIELMQGWLEEWYEGQTDDMAASMMADDMTLMMSAMTEFDNPDVAFLTEMSLHHNSAIDMAQLALLKAIHPKLRELAKGIIRNQAQEIADYQEVLAELTGRF